MPRRNGGRSSYSAPRDKAPPPAHAPKGAPAPAPGGSVLSSVGSAIADGWGWGAGTAMAHRAMDAVLGPRTIRMERSEAPAAAAAGSGQGPSSNNSACDVHAVAFQDCINRSGSDISKCQLYVDLLSDCRRRRRGHAQAAIVEP